MAKDIFEKTVKERSENPEYYLRASCDSCKSEENICYNDYNNRHLCRSCVNDLEDEIEEINKRLREAEEEIDYEAIRGDERRLMENDLKAERE
jgi:hypothetical protein